VFFIFSLIRLTVAARADIIYVSGGGSMETVIRQLKEEEFGVLGDFLYEAIFIPEGVEPPPVTLLKSPS